MTYSLVAILAIISALGNSQTTQEDRMVTLATTDQPIVTIGTVAAPVKKVWEAWTTSEGIRTWMVASGTVDFRIGGVYRTSYLKDSDLKGSDTIENTILAYDPLRMISIKATRTPENFPFKNAIARTWTVIYFKELDATRTEVLIRMNGYDATEESMRMKAFFVQGNQATLDALIKKFAAH